MKSTLTESNQTGVTGTARLDSVLDLNGVRSLHERLLHLFDHYDVIDIDGSAVVSIDTSTLQLLIVLMREAAKAGKIVNIRPSKNFLDCAKLLGVGTILKLTDNSD